MIVNSYFIMGCMDGTKERDVEQAEIPPTIIRAAEDGWFHVYDMRQCHPEAGETYAIYWLRQKLPALPPE